MLLALVLVVVTPLPAAPLEPAHARAIVEGLAGTDPVLFPAGLRVEASGTAGDVVVRLRGLPEPSAFPPGRQVEHDELRRETLLGALSAPAGEGLEGGVTFFVEQGDGRVRRLGHDLDEPAWPAPSRAHPPRRFVDGATRQKTGTARLPLGGALTGLRVAISAGHGWLDNGDGTYSTQRSNHKFTGCGSCRGITEDFFSSELVTQELIALLQNMGATVLLVREHDHREEDPVFIDDGDELYAEDQGTWIDGATPGVGHLDDYRTNAEDDPGRVIFTVPPQDRARRVSLRWPEGANRTQAAIVSIVHEGGVRTLDVDQTQVGRQWLDLGVFPFGSGGAVELAHGPTTGILIADAVKVGGGMHPDARKPWWQMAAKTYVPFAGASAGTTSRSDVTIRPAYAEELDPDVYISIHANASGAGAGSTAHGTSTYRYSCGTFGDHTSSTGAASCDDPPGSRDLLDEVHAGIMGELRADWDPQWADRGRLVADFGELRELDDTPGILIETGFFDNLSDPGEVRMSDNQALHDPRWREAFTVGVARGLARFLSPGTDAPPARPDGLAAINTADGKLAVRWNAVEGATAYRVSLARLDSTRGRAFDEGRVVEGTSVELASPAIEPGRAYAIRVAAVDGNGEGFPSQAVVAGFRGRALPLSDATSPILVVWAYDRRDAYVQNQDNDLVGAIEHGRALVLSGALGATSFDGALDEVIESDALALAGYRLVDVAVGKDSTEHEPLSLALQERIAAYLDDGGAVIASGEEIGYAMVEVAGDASGAAFLLERFGATYVEDDAETFDVVGAGVLASLPGLGGARLDDGSESYEVVFPDVWAPADGAELALAWPDGRGAAVVTAQTALVGAGLEAIVPEEARAAIVEGLALHLVPDLAEELPAEGEGEGEGEEPGEGEGEDAGDGEEPVDFRPSTAPPGGCGCGSASPPDAVAGTIALFALFWIRTRRLHIAAVSNPP